MIKYFSFRDSLRYLYPNKAIRPNSCKGIQADTGIGCMGNETGHTETWREIAKSRTLHLLHHNMSLVLPGNLQINQHYQLPVGGTPPKDILIIWYSHPISLVEHVWTILQTKNM